MYWNRATKPPILELGNNQVLQHCISSLVEHAGYSYSAHIRAAGHKGLRIKPLDDATAFNQGAEVISEAFIFSIAGGLVCLEVIKSEILKIKDAESKKRKEEAKQTKLAETFRKIEERLSRIESDQCELRRLSEERSKKNLPPESPTGRNRWWPPQLLR
jgi:hypothetical protein